MIDMGKIAMLGFLNTGGTVVDYLVVSDKNHILTCQQPLSCLTSQTT